MAALPTGTVTFLFTDIEGSTTRWEHQRAAMQTALARHDAILRTAIEARGGHVFKTVGDAFYAVFTTAPDAVDAAIRAQALLKGEAWDAALGALRVRTALHTGTAEERDGDYFGQPLNRVARLLSAGHGGQILLSLATHELVRDQLPAGVELRNLHEHRLKDLIRPERIFQLVAPDLEVDYLPLRTLASHPNNLPLQPTPLVGREREVGAVRQRLMQPEVRLLTLTGVGGTGKTRLALQVAAELLESFQDGVWFVNLAPIRDPNLVISAIATTLGLREAGGQPVLETVQAFLQDKQLLLLLDNFEHVLPAAGVVAALLREAAHLKVLVTSRSPLHLQGEREYPVPPLELPNPQRLPPLERLQQYEAIKLFIQAAQAVRPDFQVTNANAPAVAEICAQLDGLPLAIELAAARSKLLPPEALLARLQSRLRLLTGGARDLAARHQALRSTIDWSYELLPAHEQRLFARLAVFVGGWSIEAATAVCDVDDEMPVEMLDALQSLLDKSLITPAEGDDEPRFTMLETIREYALEQLHGDERVDDVRQWHAHYFHHLAQRAAAEWRGPRQLDWHRRLREEHANLLAALEWSGEHELEICAGLTAALPQWWLVSGRSVEGRRWLHFVLEAPSALPPRLRAHVLLGAGLLEWNPYVEVEARDRYAEGLALAREAGDAQADGPRITRACRGYRMGCQTSAAAAGGEPRPAGRRNPAIGPCGYAASPRASPRRGK